MVRFFHSFIREEQGQATLEYVLLLSFLVTAAIALSRALLGALDRSIQYFGGQLEKDLRTGRAKIGIWKN